MDDLPAVALDDHRLVVDDAVAEALAPRDHDGLGQRMHSDGRRQRHAELHAERRIVEGLVALRGRVLADGGAIVVLPRGGRRGRRLGRGDAGTGQERGRGDDRKKRFPHLSHPQSRLIIPRSNKHRLWPEDHSFTRFPPRYRSLRRALPRAANRYRAAHSIDLPSRSKLMAVRRPMLSMRTLAAFNSLTLQVEPSTRSGQRRRSDLTRDTFASMIFPAAQTPAIRPAMVSSSAMGSRGCIQPAA